MSTSGIESQSYGSGRGPSPLGTERANMELQGVYLRRLRRLLQLRKNHEGQLNSEGVRLLDRSIYATYCDCVAVGAPDAAQEVIRKCSLPLPTPLDDLGL